MEHVLETIQRTAQVNTLLVYSHTYQRFTQSEPVSGHQRIGALVDPEVWLHVTSNAFLI